MPTSKLFSGIALLAAIALTTNGVVAKPAKMMTSDEPTVIQLSPAHRAPATPVRDDTDDLTFRWLYSSDGGENWSAMMDAGVTGMIDTTGGGQQAGWGDGANGFGVVADGSNNLHFITGLDA